MYNLHYRKAINSGQRGAALIVVLLALVVLMVLGVGMLQTSVAGLRTSANDRMSKSALAIAESGVEFAREQLRTQLRAGPITLSQTLATVANGGTLVNATQISAFNGSSGLRNDTTNTPLIPPRAFGGGSFQVFLTNDRCETLGGGICLNQPASVQSTADTNNRIMLTSLGTGPGGSLAVVQEQLKVTDAFSKDNLPATIILPGPDVDFQPFTANQPTIDGCDGTCGADNGYPTIAVSSQTALNTITSVFDNEPYNKNTDQYLSAPPLTANKGTGTFENFLRSTPGSDPNPYEPNTINNPPRPGDSRLVEVAYLQKLVATIKSVADYTSTGDTVPLQKPDGSAAISVIDNPGGEVRYSGNPTGYGILLVTGQLTFTGTPTYHGLILCVGDGRFLYSGNGNVNSGIFGSILVANINHPYSGDPQYVGVPYYHDNGGGKHTQQYDPNALSTYANAIMPLQRLTFQQLR
jgi:Tfp pilus assembly protein PilX